MRIILGTAQFGSNYGLMNNGRCLTDQQASEIISLAQANKISMVDTAPSYGNAEERLGRMLSNDDWKIITKLSKLEKSIRPPPLAKFVENEIRSSLGRLGKSYVDTLLIHSSSDLLLPNGMELYECLRNLQSHGLIKKIGVSVYTGNEIDSILRDYTLDVVQLPISILDQRLLDSGHLQRLKELDIEIHARSIFLQGVIISPVNQLPSYFSPIFKNLLRLNDIATDMDMSMLELSIGFVLGIPEIERVVVGVDSKEQLQQIIDSYRLDLDSIQFENVSISDTKYLNPSLWRISSDELA